MKVLTYEAIVDHGEVKLSAAGIKQTGASYGAGIPGRNILNGLALLLDGPQQTWSEHKND